MSSTIRGRSRYGRFAVGIALSAGLLLSAAACGDKGNTGDDGGGTDDPAVVAEAEIAVMKVCEQIDLAPLLTAMKAEPAEGPTDVGKGVGVDPAGPQCEAQIALPPLRFGGPDASPSDTANARLNVAALPYLSVENAAAEYDTRLQQVAGHLDVEKTDTPLTGEWTKGVLVNGRDQATNRVYALVQKDSYLLKIEMSWETDADASGKFPFTRDDVAGTFQTMMTPFYTAVSAKAGG